MVWDQVGGRLGPEVWPCVLRFCTGLPAETVSVAPLLVHPFVAPHCLSRAAATGGCLEIRAGCALAAGCCSGCTSHLAVGGGGLLTGRQSPLGTPWEL